MSGVWPPTPPSPPSECVLPPHQRPKHTRRAVRGWEVNILKDASIGLASYSIISLRFGRFTFKWIANKRRQRECWAARMRGDIHRKIGCNSTGRKKSFSSLFVQKTWSERVCTVLFFGAEIQPKHLVFCYLGFLPGFSWVFCCLPHPMHSRFQENQAFLFWRIFSLVF